MPITVIVPSRGRPDAAMELATAFYATRALATTHLLFALDEDDPYISAYTAALVPHPLARFVVNPRMRVGPTLNHVALSLYPPPAGPDVIGFMGDDHRPHTQGWDRLVEDALTWQGSGVAYGDDLIHGERLPTAAFISAELIHRLGYMVPPGLVHLYLDNFWLELGRATKLHYLPVAVFEHLHPIAGKAQWDTGYAEVNSPEMYAADQAEFERFMREDWPNDKERLR